ncbi:cellulase family glycosylhydrolase [Streptomyces sp. S3(2020)]|uniref:cellulase family glycosylhydrolase n=1 Tax=Streptomyces sp. S3(2020) TaxID=2732044 RepID=UPI001487AD7E|nr:cellulase family glycosylhydrolase [Streptomyces sp. S3(2020)]NNN29214.1 cellulase family glycosylhydrolase [Streptomyces sp. S3(2020)]
MLTVAGTLTAAAPASAEAVTVTADFTQTVNPAAQPALFGLANEPSREHQDDVYPKFRKVGVKLERGTLHVDRLFVEKFPGMTLQDYVNNVDDIQNPDNWDWSVLSWLGHAQANGMTTQLNILQAPAWLTYSGTYSGIPKDWSVWQDIIRKVVARYSSKIDQIDILNEPMTSSMVDRTGSPYRSQRTAAADLYFYTVRAIRDVNEKVVVGGDGDNEQGGDFGAMGTILRDPRLSATDIQFVSYHAYYDDIVGNAKLPELKALLDSTGHSGIPVYLNEWNHNYHGDTTAPQVVGNRATTFVANTLINLANQPMITGAAFMSALPGNVELDPAENCPGCVIAQAIYDWDGTSATLWPQTRAYRLMSVAAGLGKGQFSTAATDAGGLTNAMAFTNARGQKGVILVNDTAGQVSVNATLNATGCTKRNVKATTFTADTGTNTAVRPTRVNRVPVHDGSVIVKAVDVPAYSAVAVVLAE